MPNTRNIPAGVMPQVPAWFTNWVESRRSVEGQTGLRTVLAGDSMTDLYEQVFAPATTPYSYDAATGIMTLSFSGHGQAVGWEVAYWDRQYAALSAVKTYTVLERVDSTTFKINVGANLPGVPNGSIATGTALLRPKSHRCAENWMTWLQYLSGNMFDIVNNGAQSGDTTQQVLDRLERDVLSYSPQIVFIQMPGINDSGSVNEDTIHDNRRQILRRLTAEVPMVVMLTTTPVLTGEVRATKPIMQRVLRMNRRLMPEARSLPGVIVVDTYKKIVNPTDATGLGQTSLLRPTPDFIHYSTRGAFLVANTIWAELAPVFASDIDTLPSSVLDSYSSSAVTLTGVSRTNDVITATATAHGFINGETAKIFAAAGASEALNAWGKVTVVNANTIQFPSVGVDGAITGTITLGANNNLMPTPLLTGTAAAVGGGITGNFAPSTTAFLNNTPTVSVVSGNPSAHPSGYGNQQVVSIQFTAANDRYSWTSNITDILRHLAPGRTYIAECEMELSGAGLSGANISEVRWNLSATLDGVQYQTWALSRAFPAAGNIIAGTGMLKLRTPPLKLPAFSAATQFRSDFTVGGSAAGTAFQVATGRLAIREYPEF